MQKFLKILEHNVQWIALGLGAVYLLWMAYGYVLNSPVSVTVNNTPLGPDSVVQYIQEQKGIKLESAINNKTTVELPTNDVLGPYLAKLGEDKANTKDILVLMSGTRGESDLGPNGQQGPGIANAKIQKLPDVPPAQFMNSSNGVATIMLGPGGAAPANAAAPVGLAHQDCNWWSGRFKIPVTALKDPFTDVFKDSDFQQRFNTRFLQIELLRQEKNGDKWSDPVTVAQLPVAGMPDYPGDVIPTEKREIGFQYKDAAGKSNDAILNPPFPARFAGSPDWVEPGKNGIAPPAVTPVKPGAAAAARVGAIGAQPAAAGGAALQNGDFDVNAPGLADKEVVIHDLTPQDGKTYRYAIRYRLTNPFWDASANAATPDVSKQFAIVSPPSEWSKEVQIDSRTKIFATSADPKRQRATFELFEWKETKWHVAKVDVAPGDSIKDWTIVDIRPEKDPVVLVLGGDGTITPHSRGKDTAGDYQALKALAAPAPAGAAPGGPAKPPVQLGVNK